MSWFSPKQSSNVNEISVRCRSALCSAGLCAMRLQGGAMHHLAMSSHYFVALLLVFLALSCTVVPVRCGSRPLVENAPPSFPQAQVGLRGGIVHPLRVQDGHIFDSTGRVLLFRGTNFVMKQFPWYPKVLLNTTHFDELSKWGFNAIRLGMMWSGAEVQEGKWNDTYYETIRTIVVEGSKRGVYSLLDNHQDVMSTLFCLYDGVPLFYVNATRADWTEPFPWPLGKTDPPCQRGWAENYITEATGMAFEDFYRNRRGLRDSFARYWGENARRMAGLPVLGYELWNEPWAGNVWGNPEYLLPGYAGEHNLLPLYDHLGSVIAHHDNNSLVFFEPVTWGMLSSSKGYLGSGFSRVPQATQGRAIFSFHYYCWLFAFPTVIERAGCDDAMAPDIFEAVQADMRAIGTAPFMTEWGSGPCKNCCDPNNPVVCLTTMRLADKHWVSWTQWDWGAGPLQDGWQVDPAKLRLFARPYPQATAGTPRGFAFDPDNGAFHFCFNPDRSIPHPTVLAVPFDVQYPNGHIISHSSSLQVDVDLTYNRVYVTPTASEGPNKTPSCVNITRS